MKTVSVMKHASSVRLFQEKEKNERVKHAQDSLESLGFLIHEGTLEKFFLMKTVDHVVSGLISCKEEDYRIQFIPSNDHRNTTKLWSGRLMKLWAGHKLFQEEDTYSPSFEADDLTEPFTSENQLFLLQDLFDAYKKDYLTSTTLEFDAEDAAFNSRLLPFFLVGDITRIVDIALQHNLSADSNIVTALRYNIIDHAPLQGLAPLPHEWLHQLACVPEDINRRIEHLHYSSYNYAKKPDPYEPNQNNFSSFTNNKLMIDSVKVSA